MYIYVNFIYIYNRVLWLYGYGVGFVRLMGIFLCGFDFLFFVVVEFFLFCFFLNINVVYFISERRGMISNFLFIC